MSYVLTPAADSDLDGLWQYVAAESGDRAADSLEIDLHEAMHRIGEFPGMGHTRDDLADESLRVLSVHKILIIYRPATNPVQIVRVLHGARDVTSILKSNG